MSDGRHDFAFQTGNWRVKHRKLAARLVGSTQWVQFDGTCRAWEMMEGLGNVDDHLLNDPAGTYHAATVRKVDPKTGQWSIWWFDGRFTDLGPPVVGRFEAGVGTFLGDDMLGERPIQMRFIWSGITTDGARWEQAFSPDRGKSWETNWVMDFERLS